MWKGFKVIDADAHMHEPQYLWERYVEPAYRDQVPKVAFMDGAFMVYEPDGRIIPKTEKQPKLPRTAWADMEAKYGEQYRTWWSAETRLKDMDAHGWDVQVLLPTGNNGNFAYRVALKDAELGAAMCRAYNNWCRDYCDADPKRLKFVAVLPGSDTDAMLAEARRAVEELGAVSVRNPFLPVDRWLHEPEYDALWGLACDLDFPISVHGEYRQRRFHPFAGGNRGNVDDRGHAAARAARPRPRPGLPVRQHGHHGALHLHRHPGPFPQAAAGHPRVQRRLGAFLARADGRAHPRAQQRHGQRGGAPAHAPQRVLQAPDHGDLRQRRERAVLRGGAPGRRQHPPGTPTIRTRTRRGREKALPDFDAQPIPDEAKAKILWDNAVTLFGPRILD